MEKKNIVIILVIIIAIVGIGIWLTSKKEAEESVFPWEKGEGPTEGEVYGILVPQYSGMTKWMEEKDEETGRYSVMYNIEGTDKSEEIKEFYKENLLSEGWSLDSEMTLEGVSILEFSKGKDYKLTVSISYGEEATMLVLDYEWPTEEELKGPYELASEVEPASGLNTEFHNDFKAVLESIFEGAKLKSASSDKYFEELDYIVKREITEEDAQEIRNLLEEKGYEATSTSAEIDAYEYRFSKEVLGEEYDDINVTVWLEGEGSHQQEVSVSVYK
jgi:hypothetical protein